MAKRLRSLKKSISEDTFNQLQDLIEHDSLCQAARDVVRGAEPEHFLHLLPDRLSDVHRTQLLDTAKGVIQMVNRRAKRRFNTRISGFKPKFGQIPGANNTIRSVLK